MSKLDLKQSVSYQTYKVIKFVNWLLFSQLRYGKQKVKGMIKVITKIIKGIVLHYKFHITLGSYLYCTAIPRKHPSKWKVYIGDNLYPIFSTNSHCTYFLIHYLALHLGPFFRSSPNLS